MKSSLALLATAAAVSATVTSTEWVVDVVTVTVTADPSDFVSASQPTSTPTPEPVSTSSVAPSPPPPPPANAAVQEPEPTTTTQAPPPPPTSTPEPEPVVQTQTQAPEPEPETTTQQQTAQPTSETVAPSGGYKGTAIDYHNAYRKDHSAGNLEWDETLAQYAENTANKCQFAHDMAQGDGGYGQNLASVGSTGDLGTTESAIGKAIAEQWYQKEVGYYNFFGQSDPPPGADFSKFGHFSQLVWKDSTKAGCATVKCPAGTVLSYASYFTVCNYSPPGNFGGKYATNVLPSLGLKINLST